MMKKSICIHGHFYQPPRENPWLEKVEKQDSASPYHDWNERVTDESYLPNTATRILEEGHIIDIANNYHGISFNFGPTLLLWMEKHTPDTYKAIQDADRQSRDRFDGHGSAIAQAYNHMIMPLASRRDKETQVIWGIKDFEYRFRRKPEGMWLPETAVDMETLEILANHDIRFTILAPGQASHFRKIGDEKWQDASTNGINPRRPYLQKLPSGKSIILFFYDGPISHDLAFDGLLKNGKDFADRLLNAFDKKAPEDQLVHIATDGETYGHHHHYGEMALAFCLHYIKQNSDAQVVNYGYYLSGHEPTHEVMIKENTAWSCAHGIERWRSNCGCNATDDPKVTQEWRETLRDALDWLRDKVVTLFEKRMRVFTTHPWDMRNQYINVVLDRSTKNVDQFINEFSKKTLSEDERVEVLEMLEMQRHAMLMYTSCGWFFNDISGIETVQVIQYAARVIQLAGKNSEERLEHTFLEKLEKAPGNFEGSENGRIIYEKKIKPCIIDLERVAGHFAVSSLYHEVNDHFTIGAYTIETIEFKAFKAGKQKLTKGIVSVHSLLTGEYKPYAFVAIQLGEHNILGGVIESCKLTDKETGFREIKTAFDTNNVDNMMAMLDKHIGNHQYSFWHLFRDEQRTIVNMLIEERISSIEGAMKLLFNNNYTLMQLINNFNMPMPQVLSFPGEFILNLRIRNLLSEPEIDVEAIDHELKELERFSLSLDKSENSLLLLHHLMDLMENIYCNKSPVSRLKKLNKLVILLCERKINIDLWKLQNLYYKTGKAFYQHYKEKSNSDSEALAWINEFEKLGKKLNIKIKL